ncbi:MAG: dihydroneopterin aldolase [Bacteroidales bacterium]|nr:dihydroneopterin aldolase [Bacteroidales bacterium]
MFIDRDFTIELTGMEFHAFHGCLESERREGNTFMVDFRGKTDAKKAAKTDDLSLTPDYGKVYEIIAAQMKEPSNLLENVAARIVDAIAGAGLGFWFIQVRVSKKNPPVGGVCDWSRVTATFGADLLENNGINDSF